MQTGVNFQDKVILITGASRGLGAATACWLAQLGCKIVLNGRSTAALEDVAKRVSEIGGEAFVVTGDVGELDVCRDLIERSLNKFGSIDCLINNAAVIEPIGNFYDVDPVLWKKAMDINLVAPLALARFAAESLRKRQGRVINVSTGAAVHPLPAWNAYCASKAGLHHLTRTMAVEEKQITSLSLRPGVIDTAMQDQIRRDGPGHMPSDLTTYFQQLKETKRLEPPEVPAKAMAWLAVCAPNDWSGEMIEYTDPRVVAAADKLFK
jgi:NAD(P)-dependent dehydrogenase (short-subunit alcohol dehydrogenase family)